MSKSVYWVKINADIENTLNHCSTCLEYHNMQPQEKTKPHKVLAKLSEWFEQIFL